MQGDWIKLHRKSIDSQVFSDEWLWRLWCWCLMRANWKASWFKAQRIEPGEFATGRKAAADSLGVTESKLYRGLKRLEQMGMIVVKANSNFTVVSLCNWGTYQNSEQAERTTDEQRMNNQRTTSEQPANTIEEGKNLKEREEGKNFCDAAKPHQVVEVFDCKDGRWELTRDYGNELAKVYPSLDMRAEVARIKAWWDANPTKRKTVKGMKRFLVNWLNAASKDAPAIVQYDFSQRPKSAKELYAERMARQAAEAGR